MSQPGTMSRSSFPNTQSVSALFTIRISTDANNVIVLRHLGDPTHTSEEPRKVWPLKTPLFTLELHSENDFSLMRRERERERAPQSRPLMDFQ